MDLTDKIIKSETGLNDLLQEYWEKTGKVPTKIYVTYKQRKTILDFSSPLDIPRLKTPKYNESLIIVKHK